MSKRIDLFKIIIGSCEFMQLAIFCKYICAQVLTDLLTNPILPKVDIHVRYTMIHV